MIGQMMGTAENEYVFLREWLSKYSGSSIMLVCGKSYFSLDISKYLQKYATELNVEIIIFSDFSPNPDYASVEKGVAAYNENHCSAVIAVGGGSAMDVAKCVKLYNSMDPKICYLEQEISANHTEIMAIPTTAGTGSEATRYAVIYYQGEKQSVVHESCIPQYVLFDATVLTTLNDYYRKASMLDALCHAIESFWSIHSTDESMEYSAKAIKMIYKNVEGYLANQPENNEKMMQAAYLAGKAINITQTTAGHAMCYKLTKLYDLAHGFAAALCTAHLWQFMLENITKCTDARGEQHLKKVFAQLAEIMGYDDVCETALQFLRFVEEMIGTVNFDKKDMNLLIDSVNPTRLSNHPIKLEKEDIKNIYEKIMTHIVK